MAVTHGGDIFAVAHAHNWDWHDIADFSASINPLGPAPGVKTAICQAVDRIVHYPDTESTHLRQLLAKTWNLHEDQILLGNGATDLIFFMARILKSVTLATPVFTEFHHAFPTADLARLDEPSTWPGSGVLVLTRPANPTGHSVHLDVIETYLKCTGATVIIDESFLEYSGLPSAATLLDRYPQLLILRSLTKFYALPGARIGALIGRAETLRKWKAAREPWQVGVFAEAAAVAAVSDTEHAARSIAFMQTERAWLQQQLRTGPSDANFLHVRLNYSAAALTEHMLTRKILIRNCADWPGLAGQSIRIAVRRRDENERLLQAWREFECA
ncbi:MAG: threonine-phosphate decarboxylase [Bryobacterales bacterium]|jgi:threonine-phosphate decarboxylase|nr:threonine-phosphate decarboxylase [Bryobacterales bacterium]